MPEEFSEEPEDLDRPPSFFPYDGEGPEPVEQDFGEPVEGKVEAVYATQAGEQIQRFVLLTDGERKLPIVIGPFEAQAISLPLDGSKPDRPMTHDLIFNIMEKLNATLARVVIDDLWGSTYYAKMYLKTGKKEVEIDSRPSDAIAIAVRFECPIFVAEGILEYSGQ
ncbi:MAG: bifunctional nuclease family protein [Fimbriimonadaceae bacterium]